MVKPNDTQCRASVDGERCENQISYDEAGDNWSIFCKEHREEDEAARESGEPRPERVPRTESAEATTDDDD